ncbi:unnamed protein product [Orchesella dallaii]|uniref:Lipase domain-containing protein n=1 Tax=Orchesella dallaii TaxID=48710 RepID=A0ABP1QFU1_9HEXA
MYGLRITEELCKWSLPIPWDIKEIQPELHIYSNKLGDTHDIIKYDEDIPTAVLRLQHANLLETTELIFIAHGFENDVTTPWVPEMKDRILKATPQATVFLVSWGGGASIGILKYSQAAANTQTVGAWLGLVTHEIRKTINVDGIKIYGIAHSLGSHLMGLAGRQSQAFDRITGLDPAGPSFEKVNQENRLCKTDAKVVDVIHTDGYDSVFDPEDWFAPVNHYGTLIPLGKIDFYPNWGYSQPGAGVFTIAGSHHRAIELFLWSIANPGKFVTNTALVRMPEFEKPVKEVKYVVERVEMGYHLNGTCEGLFYIETESEAPWMSSHQSESDNGESGYFSTCSIL